MNSRGGRCSVPLWLRCLLALAISLLRRCTKEVGGVGCEKGNKINGGT